jgi:hypothetical protein
VPGAPKVTKSQLKGEVAYIQGDYLIAKMSPGGNYRLFQLKQGKTATIDGVVMPLNKAPIGTVLTAEVTVTETPIVDRTTTTLKGKIWVSSPTSVIVTLENGENRQYDVPKGFMFDVDGRKVEAMELRPGMNLTATKIVESPRTEIATDAVVTGVGPKKLAKPVAESVIIAAVPPLMVKTAANPGAEDVAIAVVYRPPSMTAEQYNASWSGGAPLAPPPGLIFHAGVGEAGTSSL